MSLINLALRKIIDLLFLPFQSFSPWIAMFVLSLLTGLLLIAVYKLVSDQRGLKITKNKIKAYLLELRLFADDFPVSLRAQGQLLLWNFKYFLHALRPLAVMIIPLVFLLSHLNLWFAWEPLTPGEKTMVKIKLKEKVDPLTINVSLEPAEGYEVETSPLRIPSEREICWRIKALKPGRFQILINLDGRKISKEIIIDRHSLSRLSSVRPASGLWRELMAPGENPLQASSIEEIAIKYPSRRLNFLGLKMHWLVAYFILSIIAGLIFKMPLKVEI